MATAGVNQARGVQGGTVSERMIIEPHVLVGEYIRLEPVTGAMREAMRAVVETDPKSWSILAVNGQGAYFDDYFQRLTATPNRISYAVRLLANDEIVGTTSLYDISAQHRSVEIGSTYYRPDARGGRVNPEAKLLLLGHAFDNGAVRVQLRTDARNVCSQAAMRKLGATQEGVLRRHLLTWNGHQRDSVIYSIIADEWPDVRAGLVRRLKEFDR